MSIIDAILEPAPDGTLHLPIPEAWRNAPIRIRVEMEPAPIGSSEAYSEAWRASFGSIADEAFMPPSRGVTRITGALDAS